MEGTGKAIPLQQAWTGPQGCRRLRIPEFIDSWHMKVARLSAIRIGRLYSTGNILGTHFYHRLIERQRYSAGLGQ